MRTSSSRLEMQRAAFRFAMLCKRLFPNKSVIAKDVNVVYSKSIQIADKLYPRIWGSNIDNE